MAKISPSYLMLRNGIYYFQARTPAGFVQDETIKHKLIRRSTRTGNRREALKIARTWWVEEMSKKMTEEKIEQATQEHGRLYRQGKENLDALNAIDSNDTELVEMLMETWSPFDMDAVNYYQNLQDDLPKPDIQQGTDKANNNSSAVKNSGHCLSDLKRLYIDGRMNSPKPWVESSRRTFDRSIQLLIESVGDVNASEFTLDMLEHEYVNKLLRVPLRWNSRKRYKDGDKSKHIDEIIAIADHYDDERLASKTAKDYAMNLKSFLKWASAKGRNYIIPEWHLAFENFDKLAVKYKFKRPPFLVEDLRKMFGSAFYRDGLLMDMPERHWAPLISLYSGARRGEISKLYAEDISFDHDAGLWFMDIVHEDSRRRAKTESSVRKVPVHEVLIELGFINFVKEQKAKNEKQLFPNLKPNSSDDWGDELSSWFNCDGFLKKCGIKTEENEKKSFHTFRHTFIDYGKQNFLNNAVKDQITGHAPIEDKKNARADYEENYSLEPLKEYLDQVVYDIDVGAIKKWPEN